MDKTSLVRVVTKESSIFSLWYFYPFYMLLIWKKVSLSNTFVYNYNMITFTAEGDRGLRWGGWSESACVSLESLSQSRQCLCWERGVRVFEPSHPPPSTSESCFCAKSENWKLNTQKKSARIRGEIKIRQREGSGVSTEQGYLRCQISLSHAKLVNRTVWFLFDFFYFDLK